MLNKSLVELAVDFFPIYVLLFVMHKVEPGVRQLLKGKAKDKPGILYAYFGVLGTGLALIVVGVIWWIGRTSDPEYRLKGTLLFAPEDTVQPLEADFRILVNETLQPPHTLKSRTSESPAAFDWQWQANTSDIENVRIEFGYVGIHNQFVAHRSCDLSGLKPEMFKPPTEIYIAMAADRSTLSWKTSGGANEVHSRCGILSANSLDPVSGGAAGEFRLIPAAEQEKLSGTSFQAGAIVLACRFTCSFRYGYNSSKLANLYDRNLWNELKTLTAEIGFEEDLAYYYLGRASEGLGDVTSAEFYYQRAIDEKYHCTNIFSGCHGIDVPAAARAGLARARVGRGEATGERTKPTEQAATS